MEGQYINTLSDILKEIQEIKKYKMVTLTVPQCADFMNVREDKIRELIHKPNTDFPYFRNGSKFLINREMLEQWVEKVTKEHRTI